MDGVGADDQGKFSAVVAAFGGSIAPSAIEEQEGGAPPNSTASSENGEKGSGRKLTRKNSTRPSTSRGASTRRSTNNTKAKAAFSRAIIRTTDTTTAIAPKLGVHAKPKKKKNTFARKLSMGIMSVEVADEEGRGSGHKENWVLRECIALFRGRLDLTTKAKLSSDGVAKGRLVPLEKQPMDEFTYEVFLRQYGLPSLAKKKFTTFLSAVKEVRNSSTLVLLFYEFICRTQTTHLLAFLLQAMVLLEKVAVDGSSKDDGGANSKETVASQWLPTSQAPSVLGQLFPNHCKTRLADLQSKVTKKKTKTECFVNRKKDTKSRVEGAGERGSSCSASTSGGSGGSTRTSGESAKRERVWAVSYNDFLEAVITERNAVDEIEDRNFERLFLQADGNSNGVLEYAEFEMLVRIINPEISDGTVMQMFREALDLHAQGEELEDDQDDDCIDPVAFSVVAREHGLQAYLAVAKDGQVALMNSLFEYYDSEGDNSINLTDVKNLCADMGYEIDEPQLSLIKTVDVVAAPAPGAEGAEGVEGAEGAEPVHHKRVAFHEFIAWWRSADRASL
jgi:Ca2+-binding EF-hand superfamily protein